VQVQDRATALASNGLQAVVKVSGSAASATLAAGQAASGAYTFQVEKLAQSQELLSPPVSSKSLPLSTGEKAFVQIDIGAPGTKGHTSKVVTIDQNNTLEGLSNALKAQGVDAEVVQGSKGFQLRVTGKSGEANAVHIDVTGDMNLKALLTWPAAGKGGMTQVVAAQDAVVTVGAKTVKSPDNSLEGAVAGITLNLQSTGTVKVDVTKDGASVSSNAKAFLNAVNQLSSQIDSLKGNDDFSAKLINQTKNQLGQALARVDQNALAAVGISVHGTTLTVDTKKLDAALDATPEKVGELLTGAKGVAGVLAGEIGKELGSGGVVSTAQASAQQDMSHHTHQKDVLTTSLNRQASLLAQHYSNAGLGSYSQFGATGTVPKMSLFDYI
jgi:flagellar hook-associated protein 2